MPSALPSESAADKAVDTFGIGTYDSQRDQNGEHGEDSERVEPEGETLPEDGGPLDPFGPDRLLSYPETFTSQGKHSSDIGSAELPGDLNLPPRGRRPNDDTIQPAVESVSQSELPSDSDNPSARSDYYDKLQTGGTSTSDIWPSEDEGAYVSQEDKTADSALPGPLKNEVSMGNYLGALGNYWSGYETEDVTGDMGHPSTDFQNPVDIRNNDDGGTVVATHLGDSHMVSRTATDLVLVASLTKEFLKEFGKKDLTRRHVMAFLTSLGRPQYLASDIIRCMKHDHKLVIPDVLDTFPVRQASSKNPVASLRDKVIDLQLENLIDTDTACALGRCAADLTHVMIALEVPEDSNGG